MLYQCPLCSEKLKQEPRFYQCANNHQFDIAKEGYVNLIPANKKRSKNPGDNTEMMQARRRFLGSGHYAQLQQQVAKICLEKLNNTDFNMLDIGCGEGYYTNELDYQLRQAGHEPDVFGLDISKVAVRYAAKKYPLCHFSVASSQNLPFLDHSLNLILRIYAPCNTEEMNRCVAENGVVVTVTPAARHLYQLRALIYDDVRLHDEAIETIDGFTLEHEEHLSYQMNLDESESLDLLQMTPFAWKATDSVRQQLVNTPVFNCEADFMIRVYRKN